MNYSQTDQMKLIGWFQGKRCHHTDCL